MECRMIYNWVFILCFTLLPIIKAEELTLKSCHCDKSYKAEQVMDGTIWCISPYAREFRAPCNVKLPPKCKCTGDNRTGIVINREGTWCTGRTEEGASKLWPCENKEERETAIKKLSAAGGMVSNF